MEVRHGLVCHQQHLDVARLAHRPRRPPLPSASGVPATVVIVDMVVL